LLEAIQGFPGRGMRQIKPMQKKMWQSFARSQITDHCALGFDGVDAPNQPDLMAKSRNRLPSIMGRDDLRYLHAGRSAQRRVSGLTSIGRISFAEEE
jgi:hypothetical protein